MNLVNNIQTINELIDKLRLGEIDGSIEIIVNNKGKTNRIKIKKKKEKPEIEEAVKSVKFSKIDLSNSDFSGMDVSGSDFSGLSLRQADFSYALIQETDLSKSDLSDINFYKARISQSDFSNVYGLNFRNAYLTGSVNLYNAISEEEIKITNPYTGMIDLQHTAEFDPEEYGEHPVGMDKVSVEMVQSKFVKKRNY